MINDFLKKLKVFSYAALIKNKNWLWIISVFFATLLPLVIYSTNASGHLVTLSIGGIVENVKLTGPYNATIMDIGMSDVECYEKDGKDGHYVKSTCYIVASNLTFVFEEPPHISQPQLLYNRFPVQLKQADELYEKNKHRVGTTTIVWQYEHGDVFRESKLPFLFVLISTLIALTVLIVQCCCCICSCAGCIQCLRLSFIEKKQMRLIKENNALFHPRYKSLSYLLWCFCGTKGLHLFYLKRYRQGIVYAFTCGLCGFGPCVDQCLIPYYTDQCNDQILIEQLNQQQENGDQSLSIQPEQSQHGLEVGYPINNDANGSVNL